MIDERRSASSSELRLKIHEGLKAYSTAMGFPMVGGTFEQAILDRAYSELAHLAPSEIEGLGLANEKLVSAVSVGFNAVVGQLSAPQQMALRAGFDPYSSVVMQAINSDGGLERLLAGTFPNRYSTSPTDTRSGRRFEDLRGENERLAEARNSFAGLGLDSATVASFKASGLSRGVFDDLIEHYSVEQIRVASDFAGDLGVKADTYAGKFAGLNADSRNDLSTFVDEMRADPTLSETQKRAEIKAFRADHPDLQGLSDTDLLNIVNAKQAEAVADLGEAHQATLTTAQLSAANSQAPTAAPLVAVSDRVAHEASTLSNADAGQLAQNAFGLTAKPIISARGVPTKPPVP